MLITFSGLDGSGKSSLIEWLKESLENDNKQVAVFHMYYDVGVFGTARLLFSGTVNGSNGRSKVRAAEAARVPRRAGLRKTVYRLRQKIVWNKRLRLLVFPLDVFIFLLYRFYVEKLNQQILIMDRYFYDTLAEITEGTESQLGRFLSRLAPTPNLAVFLDVSPEEAFARKGEFSVAGLSLRRLSYQKLFRWIPELVLLSTQEEPVATRRGLEKLMRERMPDA